MRAFDARWPEVAPADDAPIFLLAAGWRSGSTLLQRLALGSGEVLLWGEPYHALNYVQDLAGSLRAITADRPSEGVFFPRHDGAAAVEGLYAANLYPRPAHLRQAHRAFFRTLLADPAREAGFGRWGLKEVRLSIQEAIYLRWVFPRARFLFLVRNPYEAYRSYRMFHPWYRRWPDHPIETPGDFGRMWGELAGGFVERHREVDGRLVRFEQLTGSDFSLRALSDYLGVALTAAAFDRTSGDRKWPLQPVPGGELAELRQAVNPLAARLGYHPPS